MDIITLTEENLEREHICCAIANEKDVQVASKKAWLKERFAAGLVFLKGNVRGKCFIEYIPAERAERGLHARARGERGKRVGSLGGRFPMKHVLR